MLPDGASICAELGSGISVDDAVGALVGAAVAVADGLAAATVGETVAVWLGAAAGAGAQAANSTTKARAADRTIPFQFALSGKPPRSAPP
jgi:hypothetical protein